MVITIKKTAYNNDKFHMLLHQPEILYRSFHSHFNNIVTKMMTWLKLFFRVLMTQLSFNLTSLEGRLFSSNMTCE